VPKLNDKKLQERIGWKPFPAQEKIIKIYDKVRDIRLAAGVRFGKSMLCAYLALRELLKDNKHIWIVAPTYELSEKVFNYLVEYIGKGFPSLARGIQNRPIPQIVTPWRSWVKCKSAENPSGLLGEELDLIIVDEVSRMKQEIWDSYLRQRLTSRQGKSVFISTPFGQNWFYKEWLRAKHAKDGWAGQFRSCDSPHFPKSEWEREKNNLPEDIFNQEYMAAFLPEGAGVFVGVRDIVCGRLEDYKPGHLYTMGVDLGKHRDFTVLIVIDRTTHHVVHFDRFKKISWPFQISRIIALSERYHRPEIWIDSTGVGDPIFDELSHQGLNVRDFRFTNKSKEHLFKKLALYIEAKRITYPRIEVLLDELEAFTLTRTEAGNYKYSAPQGLHDDCVDALALAVWPLPENPVTAGDAEPLIIQHPSYT